MLAANQITEEIHIHIGVKTNGIIKTNSIERYCLNEVCKLNKGILKHKQRNMQVIDMEINIWFHLI